MTFDMQKAKNDLERWMKANPHSSSTMIEAGIILTEHMRAALDEVDRQAKRISALEQNLLTSECREREAMRRIAELEGNSLRSDELDEIRLDAKTEYALSLSHEDWRRDLRVLLAHCDYLNRAWADDVRSHLEIEDKQRAALKAAFVEQIAQDKIAQMGRFGFVLDPAVDPYGDAKKQLAQAYPDIFREETKCDPET